MPEPTLTPVPPPPPAPPAPMVSPTGEALVPLPRWLVLVCAAILPAGLSVAAAPGVPSWLRITAGAIAGSAAALLGMSPGMRKPGAALLACVLGAALLLATPARAQALTVGPSLPAFAISPGAAHPAALAAGAGVTVGADFFPTKLLDQPVHWLTIGLDAFGSAVPAAGAVASSASVALHVCALGLFCVGGGMKLLDSTGAGALDGKLDHRSFFVLLEPDCRVMKLLWPLLAAPPAPAQEQPCDGDHSCGAAPAT